MKEKLEDLKKFIKDNIALVIALLITIALFVLAAFHKDSQLSSSVPTRTVVLTDVSTDR